MSDQELVADLKTLRTRSRDLARNNPYLVRFLNSAEENVVGPNGIGMRAQLTDGAGAPDRTANRRIEDAWKFFCDSVSVDGRHSMTDFAQMLMNLWPEDGEAFVRKRFSRRFRFGFALEFTDPDLVDELYNRAFAETAGMNEIRLSVEVDELGRRVGYWVYPKPPVYGQLTRERSFVPAGAMLHIGVGRRANQTRFAPWVHPVMPALKMLDGLDEAELVASRTAAAKMGWLVQAREGNAGPLPGEIRADGTRGPVPMEATPGSIAMAPPGYTFEGWDPQHPTTAFASFHAAIVRKIAAGLGVSYTTLANDPGDANFSSARIALQTERMLWRKTQQRLIRMFLQPVFDEFLRTAPLTGELDLGPRPDVDRLRRVTWEVPGWDYVSPLEDVQAAILAIENNLDSPQRIVGQRGLDFERDVVNARRAANELIAEAGLEPATGNTKPAIEPAPATKTPGAGGPPHADTPADTREPVSDGSTAPPGSPSRNGSAPPSRVRA